LDIARHYLKKLSVFLQESCGKSLELASENAKIYGPKFRIFAMEFAEMLADLLKHASKLSWEYSQRYGAIIIEYVRLFSAQAAVKIDEMSRNAISGTSRLYEGLKSKLVQCM